MILFLQAADDKSALGQIFNGLDKLVDSTVGLFSAVFNVKSFTKFLGRKGPSEAIKTIKKHSR